MKEEGFLKFYLTSLLMGLMVDFFQIIDLGTI